MSIIEKYFPNLSDRQKQQFEELGPLYREWNARINLISRKDIDQLYEHHILHSLAIAKVLRFKSGSQIMDIGTGGGFPGVPLAILFPDCEFLLIDSIGKKIKAAQAIAEAVGLINVRLQQIRAEEVKEKFDFIVSRAVMPLTDLVKVCQKNIAREQRNALPNGLICLKGGELESEIHPYKNKASISAISEYFEEAYFETKRVLYLPL